MNIRCFLILPALLLSSLCGMGQDTFKQEFSVGGSFGMGVSKVSFIPRTKTNMLMGAHFGLTGRWITEKHLGIILEFNYSQEGWDEKFDDTQYKYTRKVNFINMPFMSHIYFGGKRVRFFINVGPQIGYAISESTTENVMGLDFNPPPNTNPALTAQRDIPIQKKFAWGICGGPGIELRTGIGYFQLEGRYYYGLGDLLNSRKSDPFSQSSSQVMFGKLTYLMPLK